MARLMIRLAACALVAAGAVAARAPAPTYLIAVTISDQATAAPAAFPKMTVTEAQWGRVTVGKPFAYDIAVRPAVDPQRPGSILLSWQITTWPAGKAQTVKSALSAANGKDVGFSIPASSGQAPLTIVANARRLN